MALLRYLLTGSVIMAVLLMAFAIVFIKFMAPPIDMEES